MIHAFHAELIKIKHSKIIWTTLIAFGIAPVMGAVFVLILRDNEAIEKAGALADKAKAMDFEGNWESYLNILKQAIGVGGVLIFGFVASWIFGREYSDGTAKDLLALPTPRIKILNAKFTLYALWCLMLVLSNLLIALLLGSFMNLPVPEQTVIISSLSDYFITTILTVSLGPPIAFFALYGKGYLAPLGFVALTLVFAQVIAAIGYGSYFPWSIPGLYSGISGNNKNLLDSYSFVILILTAVLGYSATTVYWIYTDQTQ